MNLLRDFIKLAPLVVCIATPLLFILTYIMAVSLEHVYPVWPYVSDTGTTAPESSIFGLCLSAGAFILGLIIYVRYLEVLEIINVDKAVKISKTCNLVAASFGFVSCLGLDLVANFQLSRNFLIHFFGALLCFIGGNIYFTFQTLFTYKIGRGAKILFYVRILLTTLNSVFFIGTFVPVKFANDNFTGKNSLFWSPDDGGYAYHLVSTFSEWAMVMCYCLYFSTFYWDFKMIGILTPKIVLLRAEEGSNPSGVEESKTGKEALWT